MIREIEAKSILSVNRKPASWFGVRYVMNIYRGCEHGCIYCDSRSECYRIENFNELTVKTNAVDLLKKELMRIRKKGTIGTGAMSDPYVSSEKNYKLTGRALEVIAQRSYPVHITTKSNLILRDVELLQDINRVYACVAVTVTTPDDRLAGIVEPFAPSPTDRFKAMGILSSLGITAGITMMPVLPFLEDSEESIIEIIRKAKHYGASFIFPAFGVTLRDKQREYYYHKLDESFPGVKEQYVKRFGSRYFCSVEKARKLMEVFYNECRKNNISTEAPSYDKKLSSVQLSFLDD